MGQHRPTADTTPRPIRSDAVIPTQHRARNNPSDLPSLPVRARLAVSAGRATVRACQVLGRGWSTRVGGQVALRVDPRLTRRLAAGRTIVLVSGTNGKTTATRMLAEALRSLGPVAFTRTSAGSEQGVVAALTRERSAGRAALEVDELALAPIARATRPAVIVLLNLSRTYPQGEGLATVMAQWRELFDTLDWPCTVVANLDDPLVAWSAANAPRLLGVAAGLLWAPDALLCPDCGVRLRWSGPRWWCELCGATRPEPTWQLGDDDLVVGPEVTAPLRVAIPGRAAVADALVAVAAAYTVGVGVRDATRAMTRVTDVDGRYAGYPTGTHTVRLHLADNPAAWREVIEAAGDGDTPVVFAMEPDGVADTAAIWDTPGELLHGIPVTAAGTRRLDLAAWLETCGVEVASVVADPLDAVHQQPPGDVLVAANRPAFTALRARLRRTERSDG
jgi:UDP-N-acetylmuramyl tripeptide synthase